MNLTATRRNRVGTVGWRLIGRVGGAPLVRRLEERELLVGSLEECGLRLAVRGVSRRHAVVRQREDSWVVEDLGSRNGTFVNGLRVHDQVLADGDELGFGPVALRVDCYPSSDESLAIVADAIPHTSEQTDWCGPSTPISPDLDFARHVLRLTVGAGAPDIPSALRLLVHHCSAMGATLGEWAGWGEPDVLAQHGDIGTLVEHPELYERFGVIFGEGETRTCYRSGVLATEPPLLYCGFRRPATTLLALVVRGGEAGVTEAAGEILLRFMDQARFRVPERDHARLAPELASVSVPLDVVRGPSEAMARVYDQLHAIRDGDFPVLVYGETGVGKEHLARLLHEHSARRGGPLVTINCAAIPSELLEAELFGIGKGVASGVLERPGRFREADGGTLFLDEVGEMPLALQAKLLRAIESREVQPVGCPPLHVDVRVVAASNVELRRAVAEGRFRADLFYRLGVQVEVPPLRERVEDIAPLVQHFLGRFALAARKHVAGVTVGALNLMIRYPWPGNVRELENEIRRAVYLAREGEAIDAAMLTRGLRAGPGPATQAAAFVELASSDPAPTPVTSQDLSLENHTTELEARLVRAAMGRAQGNKSEAARLLGISRNTLLAKLDRHHVR